ANWRSTLVGLPAGWCMAFVGLVPAGMLVAVLPPAYREPGFQIVAFTAFTGGVIPSEFSMIAMATGNLIILVPYYIASVRVERQVVETRHPEIEQARIASAVRSMNRITYAVLMLIVLCWLITAIKHYQDLVYLNDDFEGGETNFIVEPEVSIKPETGMGLMFQHPLLHEGAEVTSGVKYVARTDLMYRRPGVK
ncbi:MAG TPA: hypothetical protein VLA12_09915, partial [Planctomycetaceae bacterium]|nr:hypothetical protein [Planctomycetaceae bacterium]